MATTIHGLLQRPVRHESEVVFIPVYTLHESRHVRNLQNELIPQKALVLFNGSDVDAMASVLAARVGKLLERGYDLQIFLDLGKTRLSFGKYVVELKITVDQEHQGGFSFDETLPVPSLQKSEAEPKPFQEVDIFSVPAPRVEIPDGTFTVVFDGQDADYVTLRVRTANWGTEQRPDVKTKICYLSGPDNENDYVGFAFLDKVSTRVTVWRKFRENYDNSRLERAVRGLLADPTTAGETFALASGRCWSCGRKLTVPASLRRGLGPDCAERLGF